MATVNGNGDALPSLFVTHGETDFREQKFRKKIDNVTITHTESGWMTGKAAKYYIDTVIVHEMEKRKLDKCVLIWDVYSAHRDEEVKEYAKTKNVELIFVPAGQTSTRQVHDTHIFGLVKRAYKTQYFNDVYVDGGDIDQFECVRLYMQILAHVSPDHVKRGFEESILNPAKSVPSAADDPKPDQGGTEEHDDDDSREEQRARNDDEFEEDKEAAALAAVAAAAARTHRRPRAAQQTAGDKALAQQLAIYRD